MQAGVGVGMADQAVIVSDLDAAKGDAVAWAERSDEANARLVAATRGRADLVIIDGQLQ
jgi:hypothetical protein